MRQALSPVAGKWHLRTQWIRSIVEPTPADILRTQLRPRRDDFSCICVLKTASSSEALYLHLRRDFSPCPPSDQVWSSLHTRRRITVLTMRTQLSCIDFYGTYPKIASNFTQSQKLWHGPLQLICNRLPKPHRNTKATV